MWCGPEYRKMHAGERVAIIGLGGVGLSALLGAHAGGALQIIAIDANPDKEELARELGAVIWLRDPDTVNQVMLSSGGVHDFELLV